MSSLTNIEHVLFIPDFDQRLIQNLGSEIATTLSEFFFYRTLLRVFDLIFDRTLTVYLKLKKENSKLILRQPDIQSPFSLIFSSIPYDLTNTIFMDSN